jgi:(+)-trans-carveol dehydrogenase
MGRVEGKVALITGAARGQGRSHALRLAAEGADLILIDVCAQIETVFYSMPTPADLDVTVEAVRDLGRKVEAYQVDVRDYDQLEAAVNSGVASLGRLDIVAANAGIGPKLAPAHEMSSLAWKTMLDVNLTGVWHTCKAATPHLIAGGGGAMVLTGSAAGIRGFENIGNYVAAKHGLIGLTKTLALELGRYMIRVNSVHPTQVDTPMIMHDDSYRFFRPDLENPTREDFVPASQSMHALPVPWVDPVDISNAVLFLASDEGRYITGVALPVDLGATIK